MEAGVTMLIYILAIFIIFTAIMGFADIIAFFEQKFMCRECEKNAAIILPLKGHVEDAEALIRGAITTFKYQNSNSAKIYVIDLGISEETRKICTLIKSESSAVTLCNAEEFEVMMNK